MTPRIPHRGLLAALALVAIGCGPAADPDPAGDHAAERQTGRQFVESTAFRRATLAESLVDRDNGYARLRLERYTEAWNELEVWNPPVRPLTTGDIGAFTDDPYRISEGDFQKAAGESDWSHDALMALGRQAFETYPLQLDMATGAATDTPEKRERYGLWTDRRGRVGGLVRVRLPGGREGFAKTCATCHASPGTDDRLIHGKTHARLDRGAILADHRTGPGNPDDSPADWGPGQVDVTPDGRKNPTAITDLRPVRQQSHLHWAATMRNSLAALAVRIDTLIITTLNQQLRPPRRVSFALAYYLWHLSEPHADRPAPALDAAEQQGEAIFRETCTTCHRPDGTTAEPVMAERVGTDPAVAQSPTRGTGHYRIPSLRGVADRSQFLHTGSVDSLPELFAPDRPTDTPGHPWGTDLTADQRRTLVDYLQTL